MHDQHRLLADVHEPVRGATQQHAADQRAAAAADGHEVDVLRLRRFGEDLGGRTGEELRLDLHARGAPLGGELLQHCLARFVDPPLQLGDVEDHGRLGEDGRRRKDVHQGDRFAQPLAQIESAARGPLRRFRAVHSDQDAHLAQD